MKRKKRNTDEQEIQPEEKPNNKQQVFIDEYFLCNMNATQAYKNTYGVENDATARANASRLLANANIRTEIERRLEESAMSANEVLKRLADQARASLLPFVEITSDGFVYFDFSHPDAKNYMHLVKKIKTKRTRQILGNGDDAEEWENEWVEVELYDAQSALVHLGRHHALFTDNVKGELNESISVNVYLPDNERSDRG